jgi:hypothetical protein
MVRLIIMLETRRVLVLLDQHLPSAQAEEEVLGGDGVSGTKELAAVVKSQQAVVI